MTQPVFTSDFFSRNRKRLASIMEDNMLAVLFSNDKMPRSGDQYFPYRQSSDLYYLSGISQEDTILLIYPQCPIPEYREVLFIQETDQHKAIWEGSKCSREEASRWSGIKTVFWIHSFAGVMRQAANWADGIYINDNEHWGASRDLRTRDFREGIRLRECFPWHGYSRLAPLMTRLRLIKEKEEVDVIRKSCQITANAFQRVLNILKPGMKEYELEAEIIHEYVRQGASGHAFQPVVAWGKNATVLHYTANNNVIGHHGLLLLDTGCEYQCYASDLARTIPVNGRYSNREREIYDATLEVFKAARQMMMPGVTIEEINKNVSQLLMEKHIALGLYTSTDVGSKEQQQERIRTYFPHGVAHFLGLDVHDVGTRYERLEAGMLLTCEPGMYIREENIGVRIENDILITSNGPVDMMHGLAPLEAEEIEEKMNS